MKILILTKPDGTIEKVACPESVHPDDLYNYLLSVVGEKAIYLDQVVTDTMAQELGFANQPGQRYLMLLDDRAKLKTNKTNKLASYLYKRKVLGNAIFIREELKNGTDIWWRGFTDAEATEVKKKFIAVNEKVKKIRDFEKYIDTASKISRMEAWNRGDHF